MKRLVSIQFTGASTTDIYAQIDRKALSLAWGVKRFSQRDPTTDRHGGFDLLRLRPGPVHPSLDDLVVPSSPRNTISTPNLARTPDRHSPLQPRTPELKRDPTTDRHGGFDLLRLRPGPVHPSLDDLVVPSSPRSTISIPNLVRTPDRHSPLQPRTPELKQSASLSFPVAWITGARHCTRRELRVSALLLNLVLTAPSSLAKQNTRLP
ncbi:hypothetical protein QQF64_003590 [Cirrhinus molitorella]|uniref:Uncharacterized protein n=1 Tax=Cirrhinus molitorella TaxID=172907 RepID=A0ABR3MLQ9_9TELE